MNILMKALSKTHTIEQLENYNKAFKKRKSSNLNKDNKNKKIFKISCYVCGKPRQNAWDCKRRKQPKQEVKVTFIDNTSNNNEHIQVENEV